MSLPLQTLICREWHCASPSRLSVSNKWIFMCIFINKISDSRFPVPIFQMMEVYLFNSNMIRWQSLSWLLLLLIMKPRRLHNHYWQQINRETQKCHAMPTQSVKYKYIDDVYSCSMLSSYTQIVYCNHHKFKYTAPHNDEYRIEYDKLQHLVLPAIFPICRCSSSFTHRIFAHFCGRKIQMSDSCVTVLTALNMSVRMVVASVAVAAAAVEK